MPIIAVDNTARDVFFGGDNLSSLSFKNGSTTGILYLRNKQQTQQIVTSTDFEMNLRPGEAIGLTAVNDGVGIIGPWSAISDTGGGVTLVILPIYKAGTRGR